MAGSILVARWTVSICKGGERRQERSRRRRRWGKKGEAERRESKESYDVLKIYSSIRLGALFWRWIREDLWLELSEVASEGESGEMVLVHWFPRCSCYARYIFISLSSFSSLFSHLFLSSLSSFFLMFFFSIEDMIQKFGGASATAIEPFVVDLYRMMDYQYLMFCFVLFCSIFIFVLFLFYFILFYFILFYHLSYIIYHLSSIIYHLSSIIYHLSSIIYHLSSIIYHFWYW